MMKRTLLLVLTMVFCLNGLFGVRAKEDAENIGAIVSDNPAAEETEDSGEVISGEAGEETSGETEEETPGQTEEESPGETEEETPGEDVPPDLPVAGFSAEVLLPAVGGLLQLGKFTDADGNQSISDAEFLYWIDDRTGLSVDAFTEAETAYSLAASFRAAEGYRLPTEAEIVNSPSSCPIRLFYYVKNGTDIPERRDLFPSKVVSAEENRLVLLFTTEPAAEAFPVVGEGCRGFLADNREIPALSRNQCVFASFVREAAPEGKVAYNWLVNGIPVRKVSGPDDRLELWVSGDTEVKVSYRELYPAIYLDSFDLPEAGENCNLDRMTVRDNPVLCLYSIDNVARTLDAALEASGKTWEAREAEEGKSRAEIIAESFHAVTGWKNEDGSPAVGEFEAERTYIAQIMYAETESDSYFFTPGQTRIFVNGEDVTERVVFDGSVMRIPFTLGGHRHTGLFVPEVPQTCLTDGMGAHYICACGKWFYDAFCTEEILNKAALTIAAPGHVYSDWIVDREPSVGVVGQKHKECLTCRAVLATAVIPAYPENPVPGTATPAPTPTQRPPVTPTPTAAATAVPWYTEKPTAPPTAKPTEIPTAGPTESPTEKPTDVPTEKPTPTSGNTGTPADSGTPAGTGTEETEPPTATATSEVPTESTPEPTKNDENPGSTAAPRSPQNGPGRTVLLWVLVAVFLLLLLLMGVLLLNGKRR